LSFFSVPTFSCRAESRMGVRKKKRGEPREKKRKRPDLHFSSNKATPSHETAEKKGSPPSLTSLEQLLGRKGGPEKRERKRLALVPPSSTAIKSLKKKKEKEGTWPAHAFSSALAGQRGGKRGERKGKEKRAPHLVRCSLSVVPIEKLGEKGKERGGGNVLVRVAFVFLNRPPAVLLEEKRKRSSKKGKKRENPIFLEVRERGEKGEGKKEKKKKNGARRLSSPAGFVP